jgi:hypothetical protein
VANSSTTWEFKRLTIPVRVFSIGSGVFLLILVAMLLYQKLNALQ